MAHLVEIDLLRTGEPSLWRVCGILTVWSAVRIAALLQNCIRLICEGAAALLLPLCTGDQEPVVDLHSILEQVHKENAGAINYQPPIPPVSNDDFAWIQTLQMG